MMVSNDEACSEAKSARADAAADHSGIRGGGDAATEGKTSADRATPKEGRQASIIAFPGVVFHGDLTDVRDSPMPSRPVIVDQLSGREVVAGPEELDATQPLAFYLTQKLGWNPNQIITRPQWRVPKQPSGARSSGYPVDVAVFSEASRRGDPDFVRIICECKAPDFETGIGELKTYLTLEPEARLGIWFNGRKHALVFKLPGGGFQVDEHSRIPRPTDPLSPTAATPPLRFADLEEPPNLGEVFSRLRDKIAAQDSHVNRDEFILNDLANLLICKIMDEQEGELSPDRPMAFQLAGTRAGTGESIRTYFASVKTRLTSVFTDESDRLHVDDASIEEVVRTLQDWRLLGHDRQAVGKAFQVLRGRALKGEEGAYFTPPPVVDCVVSILGPDHTTSVIDAASGTGGFLAASLNRVFEQLDEKRLTAERKTAAKRQWAADSLFAVDKDVVSTKLCKAYLTLLGDGRSHVYRANTIDRAEWPDRADDLRYVVANDRFDLALTNPPFGQNLTVPEDVGRREGLLTCRAWRLNSDGAWEPTDRVIEQQLGVAFFERTLALLKPKTGRLAIVLPETFLFSSSFRWFVDWICRTVTITHIVDVPMVAFEEFCRAKTCLLFVRKSAPPMRHQITMSFPRSLGQDKNGNPLYLMNNAGERHRGELDNEMADAVQHLVALDYSEERNAKQGQRPTNLRFAFHIEQDKARARGVLVPRFWWRTDTENSMAAWIKEHPSDLVTLGELFDRGIIETFEGHGSPPGHSRRTGDIPYVKVTDLKNWRINENPTNFIHADVAAKLKRRGPELRYGDIVTPSRASSNIGQFSMVMPWQTHVVFTKEILLIRVAKNDAEIDSFLLLALFSLKVVQDQYSNLALMQTNRDHLGDHWREVVVPLPKTPEAREAVARPVRQYFEGLILARQSYDELLKVFEPDTFGTRP
jgi:type I restriction enzyme M protein